MDLFAEVSTMRATPLDWLAQHCKGKDVLAAGRFSSELLTTIGASGLAVVSSKDGASAIFGNKAVAIEPSSLLAYLENRDVLLLSEGQWAGALITNSEALSTIAYLSDAKLILPCHWRAEGVSSVWGVGFLPSEGEGNNIRTWCEEQVATLEIDMRGVTERLWFVAECCPRLPDYEGLQNLIVSVNGNTPQKWGFGEDIRLELPFDRPTVCIEFKSTFPAHAISNSDGRRLSFGLFGAHIIDSLGQVIIEPMRFQKSLTPSEAVNPDPMVDEMFWRRHLHKSGFTYIEAIGVDPAGKISVRYGSTTGSIVFPDPICIESGHPIQAARAQPGLITWLVASQSRLSHENS
jgi:hypothetical protein